VYWTLNFVSLLCLHGARPAHYPFCHMLYEIEIELHLSVVVIEFLVTSVVSVNSGVMLRFGHIDSDPIQAAIKIFLFIFKMSLRVHTSNDALIIKIGVKLSFNYYRSLKECQKYFPALNNGILHIDLYRGFYIGIYRCEDGFKHHGPRSIRCDMSVTIADYPYCGNVNNIVDC